MAYNDTEGLIDPFGGQQDLQQGILRAVGDPATRFEEDALRILRLYRFAARFGFAIDPPTGRPGHCVPIWTACRWSGSKKSCLNCWQHPPRRHILMKKY